MTAAKEFDSVRTTVDAKNIFDGRTIPAGTEGVVLEAKADEPAWSSWPSRLKLSTTKATSHRLS